MTESKLFTKKEETGAYGQFYLAGILKLDV